MRFLHSFFYPAFKHNIHQITHSITYITDNPDGQSKTGKKFLNRIFPSKENDCELHNLIRVIILTTDAGINPASFIGFSCQRTGLRLTLSLIHEEISEYDNHEGREFSDSELALKFMGVQ